ncbi:MAG: diacylglycerol/lipid kinase family protein [Aquiluna sp.]
MKLAVIYNPQKITLGQIKKPFAKLANEPTFIPTDKVTQGAKAARTALAEGHKKILVAGGDGTLRRVVQELVGSSAAVGILPMGTGNILARNLKLPLTLDAAVKRAVSGKPYEIDLGQARLIRPDGSLEEYFFTGIAGVGMDARLMQNTQAELKKRIGWIAYIEGGIRSLPMKFERFDVSLNDQTRTLKSYSLLVGNVGLLPGAISMMPDARLDDGQLDMAAIGPRRIWNWIDFFSRITWQNNVVRPLALGRKWMDATANVKTLENLSSRRIRIRPHHPAPIQLDGDPMGEVVEVEFSIKQKALKVLL